MKRALLGVVALAAAAAAAASFAPAQVTVGAPAADAILERVDRNAVAGNRVAVSEMVIRGRRDSRSVKAKSWIQGADKSFTEYLEPARERGIKMLKLGDQLWTYSPDTDRTIAISGHMLRQSVMGSDLSYEDMMEDRTLRQAYGARVTGEETVLDRPCWVLELAAKVGDAAYAARTIRVDKERFLVLKEERFAKSGKLLKKFEVRAVRRIGDRWVPTESVFRDALKSGEGTVFKIETVEFDAAIPEALFTKASLRK
jgi:outer membrane lipoprotein-sorting protein